VGGKGGFGLGRVKESKEREEQPWEKISRLGVKVNLCEEQGGFMGLEHCPTEGGGLPLLGWLKHDSCRTGEGNKKEKGRVREDHSYC